MSVEGNTTGLDFQALASDAPQTHPLPPLAQYEARDGTCLRYRHYPSASSIGLVLIHGSGSDSKYLAHVAHALAASGDATIYTPDVRGHGPVPGGRRGDIRYIKQLEDDLADLIHHIEATNTTLTKIVVGGHSSGGGLAIRFAGGEHGHLASGYLLLAPYLGYDAPTVRNDSGGWARPKVGRIIAISILNGFGITAMNGTCVLQFDLPPEFCDGTETLAYSYRMMTGFNPSDLRKDLGSIKKPALFATGAEDEAFFADRFESTVRPFVPQAEINVVAGATHLGLVINEACVVIICKWLQLL